MDRAAYVILAHGVILPKDAPIPSDDLCQEHRCTVIDYGTIDEPGWVERALVSRASVEATEPFGTLTLPDNLHTQTHSPRVARCLEAAGLDLGPPRWLVLACFVE